MSYSYSQSTSKFCNVNTGQCSTGYRGYKGETDQTKPNAGPIPIGDYTFGNSCSRNGQRCNLIPDPSNEMFGRSAFQVHGDNGKGDQSASHGCIILNSGDRVSFKKGDKLHVTK